MQDPLGAFVPGGQSERQDIAVGPLAGLTFAVKDLFAVAGARTSFGNPDWADSHPAAEADCPLVAACLSAGATLIGRTVMDECAYSLSGRNPHYGAPTNPNAPGRVTGGSSCGSAAAVAGGLADFALGSDTGGSIRIPASYCGLHGLRPTHGALSLEGAVPLAPSFDTAGWFARDAEIMRAVGDVLLPRSPDGLPDEPTGVVLAADAWSLAVPPAQEALAPWRTRLVQRYGDAREIAIGTDDRPLSMWADDFRAIQAREARRVHGDWVATAKPAFGPEMRKRWAFVESVDPAVAEAAETRRHDYIARLVDLTRNGKVICVPGAPDVAPSMSADAEALRDHRGRVLALTCLASLAGLPQIALPWGTCGGLPIALGLIGPAGGDRMLLDVAAALDPFGDRDPGARFDTGAA